jgi:peptide/nickel transport system ATP-binding protein
MNNPLAHDVLTIEDLEVHYPTKRGTVRALRGVNLSVRQGEIVGLVGESGCGKSALLLATMNLLPHPGIITSGRIEILGQETTNLNRACMERLRGRVVSMVFQDPMSTLNPAHKIGAQIREALQVHGLWQQIPTEGREETLIKLLREVGIPSPKDILDYDPHQLSGGMQQRVLIAIALACRPNLLLADEPTTALDVTIEAQILNLFRRINRRNGTAILFVTHNLAVASQFCHRIAVMYAGHIVEEGPVDLVLRDPLHPYTRGLLNCVPRMERGGILTPIPGDVPDLMSEHEGCWFYPRCFKGTPQCKRAGKDSVVETFDGRSVRCWRWAITSPPQEMVESGEEVAVDYDYGRG